MTIPYHPRVALYSREKVKDKFFLIVTIPCVIAVYNILFLSHVFELNTQQRAASSLLDFIHKESNQRSMMIVNQPMFYNPSSSSSSRSSSSRNGTISNDEVNSNGLTLSQLSVEEYMQKRFFSPDDDFKTRDRLEKMIRNVKFAYRNLDELMDRPNRFPSVKERVKLYMSNWYVPPCDNAAAVQYQYNVDASSISLVDSLTVQEISMQPIDVEDLTDDTVVNPSQKRRIFEIDSYLNTSNEAESFDRVHFLNRQAILSCKHAYCKDTVKYLLPSFDRLLNNGTGEITPNQTSVPIFYQFGDIYVTQGTEKYTKKNSSRKYIRYPRIPVFQKVRHSKALANLQFETNGHECYKKGERRSTTLSNGYHFSHPVGTQQMEPIISKVKVLRHFALIANVSITDTLSWKEKKDMAVYRGGLTGSYIDGVREKEAFELSIQDRCHLVPRCWFVFTHASSTLIDAKLTLPVFENKRIPRIMQRLDNKGVPQTFDSYDNEKNVEELLQYKALIMLEGNDISSGLKWALFSNSIVMMPQPKLTSWAMEELLQPWVHYVPIKIYSTSHDNATTTIVTDAEEKMQWILDNENKARDIVKASTLWIADLALHPDAERDEQEIFDEIARRYLAHFVI